jgi:hypothetical protein
LAILESDDSLTIFDISTSLDGKTLILNISFCTKNSMFRDRDNLMVARDFWSTKR